MITPAIAVNTTIKPSLTKDFGIALTTLIILQNSQRCSLMIANLDRDGYRQLVGAIASDYRVVKALGENDTEQRKQQWLAVVE